MWSKKKEAIVLIKYKFYSAAKIMEFSQLQMAIVALLLTHGSWPGAGMASTAVSAAKILGLFAHPSESHFAVMRSVMGELARRGHNVTVYNSHGLNERIENVKEHIIEPESDFWRELQRVAGTKGSLFELSQRDPATLQRSLATVGGAAVSNFLSHAAVQRLLQLSSDEFDYDLIIVDLFYTEALLALGHAHAKPTIAIVSSDFEGYMQLVLESMVPAACSPIDYESDGEGLDGSSYWHRVSTIRECMARRKRFVSFNMATQEQLVAKHFAAHFKGAPPNIATLQSHLAVLLLNNHVPLTAPRPLLPNTIAAGGLHIRVPRELPWNIRRFLDEARFGVVHLNLGNEWDCADVPSALLAMLFDVCSKQQLRVLWTCHNTERLAAQPAHVMVQHSVPQTDILAHPHVKLFVMNGDLLSLQEGILRHKPLLGLPIFRNEVRNMHLVQRLGIGISLSHANVTQDSLAWAMETLAGDATFTERIRGVSAAFRDRPLGALETTMYWVDYVLRHKGGAAIRVQGVGIASAQLHLFDLFIFYFGAALLIAGCLAGVCYAGFWAWQRQQSVLKMASKRN